MARIMVVEDDVYMREELTDLLRKSGYETASLFDFENAIPEITEYSPDLVLLDINLPFHSGFEICKELKAKQLGTVLVLTARDKLQDELHALGLGADDYLTKPCNIERLLARIKNLLRRKEEQIRQGLLDGNGFLLDPNTFTRNSTRTRLPLERAGAIMKKLKIFLTYISSNRVWIITLACLDVFFIFLAWLANPDYFINYVALIIFVSFATLAIPLAISIRKRNKTDAIFRRFLLEPDDTNEYLLCEAVPAVLRPYICELGQHLRTQQEYINEQKITVTDYQHYIENWVHEIKKPLSLMTLLLDNRKDEMSPLVHTRMLYVRDHTRQDIEQILYFSRLGATHKDYFFEPLSILEICREAVEDNLTLLEEAGFSVEYTENDAQVISDKKGLMFILGQIISNSVKYTGNNPAPRLLFSIADSADNEQISLSMKDNGTSIPLSDLPFVFDKGFTGDTGSYLSRSTGMGLYLVQKMATDLSITVELKNNSCGGTTVTLTFPKVERPFGR